jgi:hypothetical protein
MNFKVYSVRYDTYLIVAAKNEADAHINACKLGGSAFEGKVIITKAPGVENE